MVAETILILFCQKGKEKRGDLGGYVCMGNSHLDLVLLQFRPEFWQTLGVVFLYKCHEFLPHQAAQIPSLGRICCAHQRPQLQRMLLSIGHLQAIDLPIPKVGGL